MSIPITVALLVPAIDLLATDAYGAGALLRIERATSQAGAFAEVTTVPLVSGTDEYTFWDTGASTTSWYRTRISNAAGSQRSGYDPPFPAGSDAGQIGPGPTGHCYASLDEFKRYLVDNKADFGNVSDGRLLGTLQAVSRTIDAHCARTGQGFQPSAFGPRVGTNRYSGSHGRVLRLEDDLLSLSAVTVAQALGSTPITYTDETDFIKGPFDSAPYRELELTGLGQTSWYGVRRGVSIAGIWGNANLHEQLGSLTDDITASQTSVPMDVAPSSGNTLFIGTEQLYVRSVDGRDNGGFDVTVVRGVNGTTAAVHANTAQVDVFTYPADVTEACLAVAQRRRKSRDAGLTGDFGGGAGIPLIGNRDTERSMLREYLWQLTIVRIS